LQLLVEHRRRLVSDRTRVSNRLTALLKAYFPQALSWLPDLRTALACDSLLRWPSPGALKGVRRATLLQFFRAHNSARPGKFEERLGAIRQSMPLVTDAAVINSSVLMVKALASQMKATIAAIKEFDAEIEGLCATHEDFELFASLPGAGEVYASRLLAAMGTDRGRWASADEVARYTGIAPVVERSVQSCWVRWRYLRPEVPPPELPRVRRGVHPPFVLGAGLLRAAAREGQRPPRGDAGAGLQVGADHLPLLADPNTL
jgi:transposase